MNYYVKDFGAIGDGKTLNTAAIQAAIDKCYENGGGRVVISDGTYMTGTIVLKNNVDLHFEANGRILGSPRCGIYVDVEDTSKRRDLWAKVKEYGDYPDFDKKHVNKELLPRFRGSALIVADEAENISITGNGVIDANGDKFIEKIESPTGHVPYQRIDAPTPPRVVFLTGCKNVLIEDVTMVNQPGGWSYWIHDCDYVTVDRIKIDARVDYPNNDGVHINCSRNVTVSNSCISCGDDCIVVRANSISLKENTACEKVTVTNCNLTSHACGIRIGWLNDGTIRNCTFSNIVMTDTIMGISVYLPTSRPSDYGRESTLVENLSFNNIIMDNIFSYPIRIEPSDCETTHVTAIRNLYFSNIHARGLRLPIITGTAACPLYNIRFSGCSFEALEPPADGYLESLGILNWNIPETPSVVIKHVKGLSIDNTEFISY